MSSAHGLLARQSWVGANIEDVVSNGLMAHDGNRIVATGPQTWIDAQSALSLAMALHELGNQRGQIRRPVYIRGAGNGLVVDRAIGQF